MGRPPLSGHVRAAGWTECGQRLEGAGKRDRPARLRWAALPGPGALDGRARFTQ